MRADPSGKSGLKAVIGQSLTFFGISVCARVSLTNCRSTAKQACGARRAHLIEPKGILVVRARLI